MLDQLNDRLGQSIEAIQTWAIVLEIAAVITAAGVLVMAATLITYAVMSVRRQEELLQIERHRDHREAARDQISQAARGFGPTYGPRH